MIGMNDVVDDDIVVDDIGDDAIVDDGELIVVNIHHNIA